MSVNRGVLYIAFGESYRRECAKSIDSLKRLHPKLPVCVVTDSEWRGQPEPDVVEIHQPILSLKAKPTYISRSPFNETLYLDTDTRVVRPIERIFELLAFFDIGVNFRSQFLRSDPYFMPWCNSGVILFKTNEAVRQTFESWLDMFCSAEQNSDGADALLDDRFLPVAIAKGRARVVHLTPGFNFFLSEPQSIASPFRIVHSRSDHSITSAIASTADWEASTDWHSRVWLPQMNSFFPKGGLKPPGMWRRDPLIALSLLIRKSLRSLGLRPRVD